MEIRRITKTDGKRIFVEINKGMIKSDFLPDLKKGDEVLLMPIRKLTVKQMESLLGKYVKFFDIDEEESFALCFEGIIKKNKDSYWDEDDSDEVKKGKYLLIDSELGPMISFDNLNDVFDLQVIPGKEKFVNKVSCIKCKKNYFEGYAFCPFCGKKNNLFKKEDKNGIRKK